MKVAAIIPARFHSTRLPGKPLADIGGKPMIRHVYEAVRNSPEVTQVIVATDDQRICDAVADFGGTARMTSANHATGTDRIAEAADGVDAAIVINVQGDEPFITAAMISDVLRPLLDDPALPMSTLMHQIGEEGFSNPNVVKVVTDRRGNALYFSRSLIPFPRNGSGLRVFEHIGVYCYRREFLAQFIAMEQTPLERAESLEQLRALENGYRIAVVETADPQYIPLSIDTAEDLERARQLYLARQNGSSQR
ncbi:MAG TPA: 3-deoxy-manno-octulosonate cytidylyltransferase [Spirochaetia bacterium]|nr:3-deoxy-manno-octulosonate cytidylyltransferase [Spirochaetia bacterium]